MLYFLHILVLLSPGVLQAQPVMMQHPRGLSVMGWDHSCKLGTVLGHGEGKYSLGTFFFFKRGGGQKVKQKINLEFHFNTK